MVSPSDRPSAEKLRKMLLRALEDPVVHEADPSTTPEGEVVIARALHTYSCGNLGQLLMPDSVYNNSTSPRSASRPFASNAQASDEGFEWELDPLEVYVCEVYVCEVYVCAMRDMIDGNCKIVPMLSLSLSLSHSFSLSVSPFFYFSIHLNLYTYVFIIFFGIEQISNNWMRVYHNAVNVCGFFKY